MLVMTSTLCKSYKISSSLAGLEILKNGRVGCLIGRWKFFFGRVSVLVGRQESKTGHVSGQRPLRIFLKNITGRNRVSQTGPCS